MKNNTIKEISLAAIITATLSLAGCKPTNSRGTTIELGQDYHRQPPVTVIERQTNNYDVRIYNQHPTVECRPIPKTCYPK